jgi:hypothetical protein
MSQQPTLDQVKRFLSGYSTEPGPYDFNGLLHLILVGVDNLREHAIDQDFEDFACAVSDEQAAFLQRLLDNRPRSNALWEEDK